MLNKLTFKVKIYGILCYLCTFTSHSDKKYVCTQSSLVTAVQKYVSKSTEQDLAK